MVKKLCIPLAWLFLSAGAILCSIAFYQTYYLATGTKLLAFKSAVPTTDQNQANTPPTATNSGQIKGISTLMETTDARPQIVANFLERYHSPLTPYDQFGQFLVDLADEYDLDFRLLPAIAMQESNLCKKIPEGSFNCLGFGIHAKGTLMFDSFEANFSRAAKEIRANYVDQGRVTPELIMAKYTPHSNGSWANSVKQWMAEMRYDDRALGREMKDYEATVSASP